jgi:trigger factor
MTTFVREDIDALTIALTCTVLEADYKPKVVQDLKRVQRNAALKGFRAGKAPQALIDKMYGKGAIYEAVIKMLDDDMKQYLSDNNVKYLGQPLPVDDNFDLTTVKAASDFTFKYELGLYPTFTLQGVDESTVCTAYEVEITDAMIDEEIDGIRKRHGQRGDGDAVEEESMLTVKLVELEADGAPKTDGVVREEAKFYVNRLSAYAKDLLLGKSVGDTVNLRILEVEDTEANRVKSWILGIEEDAEINENFAASIVEIKNMLPAALDQAFFDKMFGEGEITTETELRERFKLILSSQFAEATQSMLLNKVYDNLLAVNEFAIPEGFMRKWLQSNNEKLTDTELDKEWHKIVKDIRWSIMKNELSQQANVQVTEQEIVQSYIQEVTRYFGNYASEQIVNSTVERMLQNEEAVERRFQEILTSKLLQFVANKITKKTTFISKAELDELVAAENKKMDEIAEEVETVEAIEA